MARLPIVGSDSGTWGVVLNDYLSVVHETDGTLKSDTVGSTQINASSVASSLLLSGSLVSRPAAATENANLYYLATDDSGGTLYRSNGSSWSQITVSLNHGATHGSGGSDALSGNLDANARVTIAKDDVAVAARRSINILQGNNLSITAVDNSPNERVDVTLSINKPFARRVVAYSDTASITPDISTTDILRLDSLSQTTTFTNPSGSPVDGQYLILRIKSSGAQSISFGTGYRGSDSMPLPTSTTGSGKVDYYGFLYNIVDTKWDFLAKKIGF